MKTEEKSKTSEVDDQQKLISALKTNLLEWSKLKIAYSQRLKLLKMRQTELLKELKLCEKAIATCEKKLESIDEETNAKKEIIQIRQNELMVLIKNEK